MTMIELSCIVSGAATFTCGGQTYAVRRGDLVFNPRATVHAIDADGDLRFYYIGFAVADRTDPVDRRLGTFFDTTAPFAAPYDTELTDAFSGLFQNYLNPDEFSTARMTDAVRQLLIASVRAHRQTPMRVYHPTAVPEKSRLLAELCAYLDGHPAQIDALAQLSRMENCGIRFTDIRPGFVATPLLSGDGRYPMLMRTEKVAARIMHVLRHPRRRVVIDRRYALMVFFWKLIPEWLWERLNIRKDD